MGLLCTLPRWNTQRWCSRQREPRGTVLDIVDWKGRCPWPALSKPLAGDSCPLSQPPEGYDRRFTPPNLAQ